MFITRSNPRFPDNIPKIHHSKITKYQCLFNKFSGCLFIHVYKQFRDIFDVMRNELLHYCNFWRRKHFNWSARYLWVLTPAKLCPGDCFEVTDLGCQKRNRRRLMVQPYFKGSKESDQKRMNCIPWYFVPFVPIYQRAWYLRKSNTQMNLWVSAQSLCTIPTTYYWHLIRRNV